MWNMKCYVIPVITGAMGIVIKSLKHLATILAQRSVHSPKNCLTRNITHLKPEWWGSPLAQEKTYQGE
jgi:hypothetical protein